MWAHLHYLEVNPVQKGWEMLCMYCRQAPEQYIFVEITNNLNQHSYFPFDGH